MSDISVLNAPPTRPGIVQAEWQTRVELAALYRLVVANGWDDLIYTHISARVPGDGNAFLINRRGLAFDEVTASNLVKVDIEGNVIDGDPDAKINRAGYVIHSAIHAAREDAHFVIHLHTLDGMAVSCQNFGLLPLVQTSLSATWQLAYHDYEGAALELAERDRIVADLGSSNLLMLRNHGTLAVGASAGETWMGIYFLERACSLQIRALSAGRENISLAPQEAQHKFSEMFSRLRETDAFDSLWTAMMRRVERDFPGFDQ